MAMRTSRRASAPAEGQYQIIGTRPLRHDAVDKVTGRAQYGADIYPSGVLPGRILRSPHAHARILFIDTSRAEALTGVRAVVTSRDFPSLEADQTLDMGEANFTLKALRDNVLASDKVLYKGHPVAGVVAVDDMIAEEALGLIRVEYEVLPPVISALEGMKAGAPLLHEDMHTDAFGKMSDAPSNVASHTQHSLGDEKRGFASADVVVEREFHTQAVHQGYIEPHNATVFWNQDGKVTVWCSTQGPFEVRDATAAVLGLPVSDVRLVPMEIGGGFGGKFEPYGEPVAALLSRKCGRPVRIIMSRTEEFESTGPTSGSYIRVKMGATREGKITAAQAYMAYEAGAYPGSPVGAGALCIFAPYNVPNLLIDALDVVVNKPKAAAYRAPGATNASFAAESVVDELAERLGLDPLDFRLRNAAKRGTRRADGIAYPRIGCQEVLEALKAHPHYRTPLTGPNRGRGVAAGYWMNGGGPSSCTIRVNADGTVYLSEGSPDIGGTRTSVAMQAAEVLGIPAEAVRPMVVDTDAGGYTSGTGGSSVTFKTGMAAHEAAQDVKRQMIARGADLWNVPPEKVVLERGVFRCTHDPKLSLSFAEMAEKLLETGAPIVGNATVRARGPGGAFAGCIVDVEVDPETGKVTILRCTVAQDAGRAIHPTYVEGQMQGGTVQGISWALSEEHAYNAAGAMMNATFLDYRVLTALDLPMIDTVIVEVPNPTHPFGVRGVGEVSIVPPAGALASAIYRAAGVRLDRLPMNPEVVKKAIAGRS
ncbi:MAG: xanthine dehydrogenase family protein molybdopterin-binding subunit [Chloroflexi bacterium]|nr:xanthine dehydrogenase family protein molybdopterin-binding subunit [Chloroflexota bacterium]